MSVRIPIRHITALRSEISDQALIDFLDLSILTPEPGLVATALLRSRWRCSQPQVSRRIAILQQAGLIDVTPCWGGYQVHALKRWEVAA